MAVFSERASRRVGAEQHSQTADYVNRWKFTGHELDRETGLYYAGARYYDPRVSIWLSVDPLAEDFPSWNPYAYTFQNPINFIDPDGREGKPVLEEDCCGDNGDRPFGQPDYEQQPTQDKITLKSIDRSGEQVYEEKTSFLGKLWNTVQPREWTDPETGVTYQVNADGTVRGVRPLGGAGGMELIGGNGAIKGVQAVDKALKANRLHHIFGKSEHALGSLVKKFGSEEKAFNAVQIAADKALAAGKLTPNAKGILPNGNAGNIIDVGGMQVRLIGGKVEEGKVILSSFSRKGL